MLTPQSPSDDVRAPEDIPDVRVPHKLGVLHDAVLPETMLWRRDLWRNSLCLYEWCAAQLKDSGMYNGSLIVAIQEYAHAAMLRLCSFTCTLSDQDGRHERGKWVVPVLSRSQAAPAPGRQESPLDALPCL